MKANRAIRILSLLGGLTPLILGVALGVGSTLLIINYSELVLDRSIVVAFGICIAGLLIFLLARVWWIARQRNQTDNSAPAMPILIQSAIDRFVPSDQRIAAQRQVAEQLAKVVRAAILLWSGTVALGIGIAALAAALTLVQALAAIRQVDRIEIQNRLIQSQNQLADRQMLEARIARISSIYSAQLPILFSEIESERDADGRWKPSQSLIAQIQNVVNSAEPYKNPDDYAAYLVTETPWDSSGRYWEFPIEPLEEPDPYSPQRGQLLLLLLAQGMDFAEVSPPLNFARSDLTGTPTSFFDQGDLVELEWLRGANLGTIDLSRSNLFKISVDQLTFSGSLSGANLRGSVFTKANFSHADLSEAVFADANLTGSIFSGSNLRKVEIGGAQVSSAVFTGALNTDEIEAWGVWAWEDMPPIDFPENVALSLCKFDEAKYNRSVKQHENCS